MASWGRIADSALTGTGSIDANTNIITGSNTTIFTTELEVGNIVTLDVDNFIVREIVSDTELRVEPLAATSLTDEAMLESESPKYLPVSEVNNITYVETSEINANTRADGIKTPGWTLYEEYGNGRKRVETLVAMKTTS